MSKVVVLCPANVVTGGPELLHQFVHELRVSSIDASVLYYPYGEHVTVDAYKKYNIKTIDFNAIQGDEVIILPEVATNLAYDFEANPTYIWWLSVDNYFKAYPNNILGRIKFNLKKLLNKRLVPVPLKKMDNYKHLSQSEYGLLFLKRHGVRDALKLTDYLNEVHLNNVVDSEFKQNIVAYNPKKGVEFTKSLIHAHQSIRFVPIQNMTAEEVGELLNKSKVYIDFGEHPGKDRIPREAAMANCIIITGKRGSAANNIDVSINNEYKFNETPDDIQNIGKLIENIFEEYDEHSKRFVPYRGTIMSEKSEFALQTKDFIKKISQG
jgi:hypothetical protein